MNKSIKNFFLVTGGSIHNKKIAKKISKNFNILLADYLKNPFCKKFSKLFIETDFRNKIDLIKKISQHKIKYVISDQNDYALNTYSYVCSKLNLPGIRYEIAKNFMNKFNCKKILIKNKKIKKHIANFKLLKKNCKLNFLSEHLIVKPLNMQGSKFVYKIKNDKKNLKNKIKKITDDKKVKFIIEEFIDGQIYAIECFVYKKKVTFLTASKKKKFKESFIDKEVNYLNDISSNKLNLLKQLNEEIISSLKLENGITHGEYIYCSKKKLFFLVEIACRGGGSGITDVAIPYLTNFNTSNFLINLALGRKISVKSLSYKNRFCSIIWLKKNFYFLNKKLPKYILFQSDNSKFNSNKKEINRLKDSHDRGAYFIITGRNKKDLKNNKKNYIKRYFKKF